MSHKSNIPTDRSRVLVYHEFSFAESKDVYLLHPTSFAAHVETASQARALGITTEFTFDDAHDSQMEFAAPILHDAGMRGRFFVPSSWVGTRSQTANWAALRGLLKAGHTIGAHGRTHSLLTRCNPHELQDELSSSRKDMEDRLGTAVQSLSAPGGRWDQRVAAACVEAGYTTLYTSQPVGLDSAIAIAGIPLEIRGRLAVRRSMSRRTIGRYLENDLVTVTSLSCAFKARHLVRLFVGDEFYQSMWRQLFRASEQHG